MATSTKLPWKARLSCSLLSIFVKSSCRSNGTVNRFLFNFYDRHVPSNPNPVDGVYSSDISVDPTRNLWFGLYVPSSATATASLPAIVYFHGGGFAFMSAASTFYDALCRQFSRSIHAVVVAVNYRLAPEHRFPSQYDDGFDVLKFLDENDAVLPKVADISKCILAGDSAGGNLAHHVAVWVSQGKLLSVKIIGLVSIEEFFGGK